MTAPCRGRPVPWPPSPVAASPVPCRGRPFRAVPWPRRAVPDSARSRRACWHEELTHGIRPDRCPAPHATPPRDSQASRPVVATLPGVARSLQATGWVTGARSPCRSDDAPGRPRALPIGQTRCGAGVGSCCRRPPVRDLTGMRSASLLVVLLAPDFALMPLACFALVEILRSRGPDTKACGLDCRPRDPAHDPSWQVRKEPPYSSHGLAHHQPPSAEIIGCAAARRECSMSSPLGPRFGTSTTSCPRRKRTDPRVQATSRA